MANRTSKDPAGPITITMPRSLHRKARHAAAEQHLSLSAWIANLVRQRIQQIQQQHEDVIAEECRRGL